MRFRGGHKWFLAAGALLLATAAAAQNGSAVTNATGEVNYARQNTIGRRSNVTTTQAYGRTGIDKVGEKSAIRVDQTQETKLSPDEKRKFTAALLSDMRSASESLGKSSVKAAGQADVALEDCLNKIQKRVNAAVQNAENLQSKLDTPGTYSQIRNYGDAAKAALEEVKGCPTKAGASGEGSSVTTTVEQVLAREGDNPEFPITVPPIVMLPPPCSSCVR